MDSEPSSPYSRMFALLIGINDYPAPTGFDKLYGALKDVERWRDLLLYLQVPRSQIRTLTNEHAHRDAILEALVAFKQDSRIRHGDPILIFYAGHGAEIEPPDGWECGDDKIQSIVPYDYCDKLGLEVPSIPDRTLGALLEDIAEIKGNNITVIFDCCYSSSGTRSQGKFGGRARSVQLKSTIHTNDLDRVIWEKASKSPRSSEKLRLGGLRSHILIAACSAGEVAKENATAGRFSKAFRRLLRKVPPHTLRYSDLLNRMDRIADQNPQIEGSDLDRFLFQAHELSPPSPRYFLQLDTGSNAWIVNAGTAHGVTPGAAFEVVSPHSRRPSKIVIGEDIRAFSSVVQIIHNSPSYEGFPLPIVQTREGRHGHHPFAVHIASGPDHKLLSERLLPLLKDGELDLHNATLVDDPALAHVELAMEGDKAVINVVWRRIAKFGVRLRLPLAESGISGIASALKSLSRSVWELERPSGSLTLMDTIQLSVFRLNERRSPFKDVKRSEMLPLGGNLLNSRKVDIVAKDETFLGIKLENKGSADIYLSLLYFDEGDMTTVTTCYRSPLSGAYLTEAPLKAGKYLTLGYGSGGMSPLSFSLREEDDLAVGFLKLIVATHPLESTSLPDLCAPGDWASLVIPVILRRYSLATPRTRSPDVWPQTPTSATRTRTTSMPCRPGMTRGQYYF